MKDFFDYIVKNKYVILCVLIVFILYALGIVDFLTKALILIALVGAAIFVGKKMQDNEGKILDIFKTVKGKVKKEEVYYYQEKKDDK